MADTLGVGKVRHAPARLRVTVERIDKRLASVSLAAALVLGSIGALVGVTARVLLRQHSAAIVAVAHHALDCLPVAAAVEGACVASEPVVADPPAVRVVRIGTVAVAHACLVCACLVAVPKVLVTILSACRPVAPAFLWHDPAEPPGTTAVDRSVEECWLDAFAAHAAESGAGHSPLLGRTGVAGVSS